MPWVLHAPHLAKQLLLHFFQLDCKKTLDIDGQFKCLKEEDKNEWTFYTEPNRLSGRRIAHFTLW